MENLVVSHSHKQSCRENLSRKKVLGRSGGGRGPLRSRL